MLNASAGTTTPNFLSQQLNRCFLPKHFCQRSSFFQCAVAGPLLLVIESNIGKTRASGSRSLVRTNFTLQLLLQSSMYAYYFKSSIMHTLVVLALDIMHTCRGGITPLVRGRSISTCSPITLVESRPAKKKRDLLYIPTYYCVVTITSRTWQTLPSVRVSIRLSSRKGSMGKS